MASKNLFATDVLRPLTGTVDCRSSPDFMRESSFRWLLNMSVNHDGRRQRREGWPKLDFGSAGFLNQDLHDQRDCYAVDYESLTFEREPITLLYPAESQSQERRLYAATRSRVYVQTGNQWRIIGRGFGGTHSQVRFQVAQLGNTLVFTNGFDSPKKHLFGVASEPCAWVTTMQDITDLSSTASGKPGLSRAKLVRSFNGCIFLMDTVERGLRYPSRVRWSGFNNPDRWAPGTDTVAGFQDLPYDENIVGAIEFTGSMLVFTNKSIYRAEFNGVTFTFVSIYTDKRANSGLLVYPNSLISDGTTVWWMSDDAVYKYGVYLPGPVQADEVHPSTKKMFDELDTTCCDSVVGGLHPITREIWWSYPVRDGNCLNSRTLVFNLEARAADYVDYGFSAFSFFLPDDRQTLDQWLTEFCTTDLNSLCEALGSRVVDDFCSDCGGTTRFFVGASAQDYCLKRQGTGFVRQRCTNPNDIGDFLDGGYTPATGTYADDGYFSIMRGPFPFGDPPREKAIRQLLLDQQTVEAENVWLHLRVGTAFGAADPNPQSNFDAFGYETDTNVPESHRAEAATCEVIWRHAGDKALRCPETRTNVASLAANTRPNLGIQWPLFEEGRFLYYEITVTGVEDGDYVAPTSGHSMFNRLEVQSRLKPEGT